MLGLTDTYEAVFWQGLRSESLAGSDANQVLSHYLYRDYFALACKSYESAWGRQYLRKWLARDRDSTPEIESLPELPWDLRGVSARELSRSEASFVLGEFGRPLIEDIRNRAGEPLEQLLQAPTPSWRFRQDSFVSYILGMLRDILHNLNCQTTLSGRQFSSGRVRGLPFTLGVVPLPNEGSVVLGSYDLRALEMWCLACRILRHLRGIGLDAPTARAARVAVAGIVELCALIFRTPTPADERLWESFPLAFAECAELLDINEEEWQDDAMQMLAFGFFHEAGHLVHGDVDKYRKSVLERLPLISFDWEQPEKDADGFANAQLMALVGRENARRAALNLMLLISIGEHLGVVCELHPTAQLRASWLFGSIGWYGVDWLNMVEECREEVLADGFEWPVRISECGRPEVVADLWKLRRSSAIVVRG